MIGVYLVILGFELDRERELERLLEPLEPLRLPPPRPLASDNSTNTMVMKRRRSTVESRILAHENKPFFDLYALMICSNTCSSISVQAFNLKLCHE